MLKNTSPSKDYGIFIRNLTENANEDLFEKKVDNFFSIAEKKSIKPMCESTDLLELPFVVGHNHGHITPNNFLIRNMKALYAAGYRTFFLENLYYDDQQEFDNFLISPDKEIGGKVGEHLSLLQDTLDSFGDCEKKEERRKFNRYKDLVEAAKEAGIRVVPIDVKCVHEWRTANLKTVKYFNYIAYQIIQKEIKDSEDEKWFALVGAYHTKTEEDGILGIAELTGARSVYASDDVMNAVGFNRSIWIPGDFEEGRLKYKEFFGEMVITNKPSEDSPLIIPEQKGVTIGLESSQPANNPIEINFATEYTKNIEQANTEIIPLIHTKDYKSVIDAWKQQLFSEDSFPTSREQAPIKKLEDLLTDNFVVAECFDDITPKEFLIKNMQLLKAAGFTTIFVPGLYYDDQKLLDEYCLNPINKKLDETLKNDLTELDQLNHGFDYVFKHYNRKSWSNTDEKWQENNYSALVKAAKEAGIRIVGAAIKTACSEHYPVLTSLGGLSYSLGFALEENNQTICNIIKEESKSNEKWCALVGNAQAKTFKGIPGIADITKVRTVSVRDISDYIYENRKPLKNYDTSPNTLEFNQTLKIGTANDLRLEAKMDVCIKCQPSTAPLITDRTNNLNEKNFIVTRNDNYYSKNNPYLTFKEDLDSSSMKEQIISDVTQAKSIFTKS